MPQLEYQIVYEQGTKAGTAHIRVHLAQQRLWTEVIPVAL